MINQQERYYNILKLNKWFAISSILFTLIWLLTFANDFNRPWKKYQIGFREIEIDKTRADIQSAQQALDENEEYASLKLNFEKAQQEIKIHQKEIEQHENDIAFIDDELYAKNQVYQFAKADYDVAKYDYEQALHGHGDLKSSKKLYEKLFALTEASKIEAEEVSTKLNSINEKLKLIRKSLP